MKILLISQEPIPWFVDDAIGWISGEFRLG